MKLKEEFVKLIAEKVAELLRDDIDPDDISSTVAEQIADDFDTSDINDRVVERVVDDYDTSEIEDSVNDGIIDTITDKLKNDPDLKTDVVSVVADKIVAALCIDEEPDEEPSTPQPEYDSANGI